MRCVFLGQVLVIVLSVFLSSCGGGSASPQKVVVNGVAQAGIFTAGQAVLKGYSADANHTEYVLETVAFGEGAKGRFSADIGNYRGVLKVEVSGVYIDEATGQLILIPASTPLKAAIPSTALTNGMAFAVTPLTDIAANKALAISPSGKFDEASVTTANAAVSKIFGFDIVKTIPATADVATVATVTSADVKAYTAALITMSQYVAINATTKKGGVPVSSLHAADIAGTLSTALQEISNGISVSGGGDNATASITASDVAAYFNLAATTAAIDVSTRAVFAALGDSATSVSSAISNHTDDSIRNAGLQQPNPFTFPDTTVPIYFGGSDLLSDQVTITGYNPNGWPVSISGDAVGFVIDYEYYIPVGTAPIYIRPGQTLMLDVQVPLIVGKTAIGKVKLGNYSTHFKVTTVVP